MMIHKTLFRSIKKTFGRYLAIVGIMLLGVGVFAGLKICEAAMVDEYNHYITESNFYDFRLISMTGFTNDDLLEYDKLNYIDYAEGSYSVDALLTYDSSESAYKVSTIPQDINALTITAGRLPNADNECVVDALRFDEADIGSTIALSDSNDDIVKYQVAVEEYTIVGLVKSPLYIGLSRGTTSIGNGTLHSFIYVLTDAITLDIYTDIWLSLDEQAYVYSDEYNELIDKYESILSDDDIYILTRNSNADYVSYESDTQIVSGISDIFPVFFFLVAVLICITTMTRMVDEERMQIGTLKAIGYSSSVIAMKYIMYAVSASLIGWGIGYFVGTSVIPKVIWMAYGSMYRFGTISYTFSLTLALGTLIVSLACSIFAVLFSCYKELAATPAQIIRPKAPKAGKRTLFEFIPALWNKLSFLTKVSVRNVFRYKKRLFMMILGISGCTALLVTGFGIKDSVQDVANYQYDEILKYDYTVTFAKDMTDTDIESFLIDSELSADECIFLNISTAEILFNSVSLITADNTVTKFVDFHAGKKSIDYPEEGEMIISSKLAGKLEVQVGDNITINDEIYKVTGIFDNYVDDYVYTNGSYESYSSAYIKSDIELHTLLNVTNVSNVSDNNEIRGRVTNSLTSINYIVVLVVISAGALAFIVIYNLTNINIIERTREIATINVIGFYPRESASYVLRENVILSVAGTLLGLILGKYFHQLVMSMIVVSLISFDVRISSFSYLISFILTIVFSLFVNTLMLGKMNKIPMAESLKVME